MEATTLAQLARDVGAAAPRGAEGVRTDRVSTDTRTLRPGSVFFALRGPSFDGGRFVGQAFARGARAAVVGPGFDGSGVAGRPVLRVADPGQALLDLAAAYRERTGFRVVAITGSAGKTTTKDLLHAMASDALSAVRAERSFNNEVGVPLTLLAADGSTDVVVLEVGTNAPGEIERLAAVARPDVAVFTCIGAAHLERLGGLEGVAREKLSLLRHLRRDGAVVVNSDDLRLRAAASAYANLRGPDAVTRCGFGDGAGLRGALAPRADGRPAVAVTAGGRPLGELPLAVPGREHALDALLAYGAAERLGVPFAAAARGLLGYAPARGRFDVTRVAGVTLVDDTYNANPTSVGASLETFAGLAAPSERVVVLGDMKELGARSAELHRTVGRGVAQVGVARLVTVGAEAAEVARGAREAGLAAGRITEVADAAGVAAALRAELRPGRAVLFKGSRAGRLERAVAATRALLAPAPARAA